MPEEQPAGIGGDPRDHWPGDARDDDADHRQLGVVGELEVHVPLGARGSGLGDDHEQRVRGRDPMTAAKVARTTRDPGLTVPRVKVDPGEGRELVEHARRLFGGAAVTGPMSRFLHHRRPNLTCRAHHEQGEARTTSAGGRARNRPGPGPLGDHDRHRGQRGHRRRATLAGRPARARSGPGTPGWRTAVAGLAPARRRPQPVPPPRVPAPRARTFRCRAGSSGPSPGSGSPRPPAPGGGQVTSGGS